MKIEVVVSPQFEIAYALADLASPSPAAGTGWAGVRREEPQWLIAARRLGWGFWLAVPDVLGGGRPAASLDEMFAKLRAVPEAEARRKLAQGLFHSDGEVEPQSAAKREWLAYIDLDDLEGDSPAAAALRDTAAPLMDTVLSVLGDFRAIFEPVWERLVPEFARSQVEVAGWIGRADLVALASRLHLPVDIDRKTRNLRALRGGFSLQVTNETRIYLIPSAFNRRRFWTGADFGPRASLFFPYLLSGTLLPGSRYETERRMRIDPWFACKALGDPTRQAIVRRIARAPQTSLELRMALRLSKANISHHIFQLREAGLIDEEARGRSVLVSLRLQAIEALSEKLLAELSEG